MRKQAFLYIFLILWSHAAAAESITTIELNQSGDALWTVEKRLPLTATEINEWESIIKKGQNISRYQKEIKGDIDLFIRSAQNFSNRSMKIEKVNITYKTIKTMPDGFGIIIYSFQWKNFSRTDSTRIIMGDAFSEGRVLSSNNVLVIRIPEGYDVQTASPVYDKRDGARLIWDGTTYRNFGKGEPALVLSLAGSDQASWMIAVFIIGLISFASVIFWMRRRLNRYRAGHETASIQFSYVTKEGSLGEKITEELPAKSPEQAILPEIFKETAAPYAATITELLPAKPPEQAILPEIFKEGGRSWDEEMIEQYLIKSGGQAFQSDIVRESGLSKSKISIVLAKMKEDGRILKVKKGKENIIRRINK